MPKKEQIPQIKPQQFDGYFFGNVKPKKHLLYDRFHIEKIEEYKEILSLPVVPHRRSINFGMYLTQGKAIRSKNLNTYEILPFQFFCLSADQITSIEYFSEDIAGFYFHFKQELFNQAQLKVSLNQGFPFFDLMANPIVHVSNKERILWLLQVLFDDYCTDKSSKEPIIAHYLVTLFNELNLDYNQVSEYSKAAELITGKYKKLLASNIDQASKVADYAHLLKISPSHLNRAVKEVTGKSASELMFEMRVLEAKVLLKQTNLRVAEIAYQIGAHSPSDFTRFFKSRTGMTPKLYRGITE